MAWYSGYGGQPTLSEDESNLSYLSGIKGFVYDETTGISGNGAVDAYNNFARSGATEAAKKDFARRLASKFGRG